MLSLLKTILFPSSQDIPSWEENTFYFADISNFTAAAEAFPAPQIAAAIGIFYEIIRENSAPGEIISFQGDAALVRFADAGQGVRAAIRIAHRLDVLPGKTGRIRLRATAGIHTGRAYIGKIAGWRTAIGDVVNIAARLQGLCREYAEPLLISGETTRRLPREEQAALFFLDVINPKGKRTALDVFSLPKPTAEGYAAALSLYRSGRFADAARAFGVLRSADPHDAAFPAWERRCAELATSPPSEWTGRHRHTAKA